ncbi:hypothetical protein ACN47E_009557 [Coniothyrium glycines]
MSSQISLTAAQAQSGISQDLRNNIYSALLSYGGIRNIESTLDETFRTTGFHDALKAYITDLLRSGQATTAEEARNMAMAKIQESMRDAPKPLTNGANVSSSGGSVNGDGGDEVDLRIPNEAITKGVKSIQAELRKVCDITYDDHDHDHDHDHDKS